MTHRSCSETARLCVLGDFIASLLASCTAVPTCSHRLVEGWECLWSDVRVVLHISSPPGKSCSYYKNRIWVEYRPIPWNSLFNNRFSSRSVTGWHERLQRDTDCGEKLSQNLSSSSRKAHLKWMRNTSGFFFSQWKIWCDSIVQMTNSLKSTPFQKLS